MANENSGLALKTNANANANATHADAAGGAGLGHANREPGATPSRSVTPFPGDPATITVGEVMSASPHTIGADQTLARAHEMMRALRVRHLPVLSGGKLVGVLSQRDLYFLETLQGIDQDKDTATDAMTSDVYVVAPSDKLADVARNMSEKRYGCAVVADVHGRVVGIFTSTDGLRVLAGVVE